MWILRAARRCLLSDLGFAEAEWEAPPEELAQANSTLSSFVEKRSQTPEGQETVQGLTSRIVAFTLHSGRDRGITWHDKKAGVVWLLAARIHRSGAADDAYPYFVRLDASGELLPTRDDYAALIRAQAATFASSLMEAAPVIVDAAKRTPGVVQEGLVGGRVSVRLVYEEGDPPMMTLAISQSLPPGEMQVPPGWQIAMAAAFLPNATEAESLSFAGDLAGEPLRDDEVAYCDFIEDESA